MFTWTDKYKLIGFGLAILAQSACSGLPNKRLPPSQRLHNTNVLDSKKTDGLETTGDTIESTVVRQHELIDSGGTFQLKNVKLLRSSIAVCMGVDMTKIKADMILIANASNGPGTEGRKRFLLSSYRAGDDIIDAEKSSIVDPERGVRSAAAADGLTDTYLRALSLIGDVVAHNCDAKTNLLCKCETAPEALEMLARCVPSIDPKTDEARDASLMLSSVCSEGGGSGMRRAVSSLLSSYAFGLAR